nr:11001_t:CDS:10 [Entrophospora candida]
MPNFNLNDNDLTTNDIATISSNLSNLSDLTSDTTPLKITELKEEDEGNEGFMIELELNKGSNMRCYTYGEEVPALPSNLVVTNENTSQGNKNKGLSSDEALDKLIKVANEILEEHQSHVPKKMCEDIKEFISRVDVILSIVSSLLMFTFYIYGIVVSDPYQFRLTSLLIEAILILLMILFNGYLYTKEKNLGTIEIYEHAKIIIEQLKNSGMNTIQGDVIEMMYGDIAPCRIKLISQEHINIDLDDHLDNNEQAPSSSTSATMPKRTNILEARQAFKPSFFGDIPSQIVWEQHLKNKGMYQFTLLETPWANCLSAALQQKRPSPVILKQAEVLNNVMHKILFIIVAIALAINFLRYIIIDVGQYRLFDQAFEILIVLQLYAILPMLPLSFLTLWIIVRSLANATILVFKFCYLLSKWDGTSLTRSTNLFESLGSTTVICSIDREGTISHPFTSVDQLLFPDENGDITVLDVAEDPSAPFGVKFEDQDWQQHLSRLKPLGLNLLLNTNCGVLKGRELTEQHRKYSSLYLNAKTKPSRQTCMCRLGKEIGFTVDALQVFSKRKEIFTCAPCHPSLKERVRNDRWEVPSMISSIYEETDAGSYQLLSDGNLEIILDNCSDYWDGQGLRAMNQGILNKIYDCYENAIVNDMQIVAYAYRPISVENNNRIPFLSKAPTDSHYFVLPNVPDEQEIISSLEVQELLSEDPDLSRSQLIRLHRLKTGQLDANLHDFSFEDNVSREDEEKFYQDVIQGQIFLSMATVFHQPKLDVCNFIEDLKLAGIRFVLFSQTAERESKAYAERLGLETDWNSCILLSSSGDENSSGDGYLEPHDIKARLPRGIENIKDHLKDVDDIPLHVSLFAECTPEANLEMIKIFQGYGEVVCCIGSALNSFNTHAFAAADVSVAMEPTHTKAQTKNGLCHYGIKGQSPMALGASFTTLPCGLFMHYDTSLYALTDLIREARRLINGLRLGVAFMIGSLLSISLLLLLSYCFFLPPVFTGYQILWIMWAIIPTLTFSFLFNPHESDTMTTMTVKNNEHLKDLPRFLVYFFLRFSLPVLFCLGAFIICLYYFDERSDVSLIFGSYGNQGWLRWSNKEQWHVFPVRLYTEQNH